MRVLGIDPGSKRCGYGLVEWKKGKIELIGGGIITPTSTTLSTQLEEIAEGLEIIYNRYSPIDVVVVEDIFFAYNPKSVLKLAQIRGAILLKVLQLHGTYREFTPLQIKRVVTGNGKATKEQVSFMVQKILGIKEKLKPFDISDALALSIAPILLNPALG